MFQIKTSLVFAAALLLVSIGPTFESGGQNPSPTPARPPAPVLVSPANGASLAQPITLDWNPVSAPGGPIGSYTWQVGTTSTFTTVVASGFTNMDSDPSIPTRTADKVSGLPNGTYFWRVKCSQLGPNGGVDSPWSTVRSFTVTGLGPAPATPSFITPANNAQFHVTESFNIQWSPVVNAQSYILEADDEPTFSYPLTLQLAPIYFGTQSGAIWGNPLTIFYRVRAVSVDGVRSLPSATRPVQITNAAPIPAGVSPVAPASRSNCAASILCGLVGYSEPAGARLRPRIQHKSQFHAQYLCSGVEPKPLRLHDHAGSARAGKLFLACTCTARRRGRSLVGWARNHGDGSCRPAERKFIRDSRGTRQRVRWQYCACASDVG